MKKIFLWIFVSHISYLTSNISFAQTTLPTSWSFSGTAPNGWTTSGTDYYNTSPAALSPPSCKLSGTGQYVKIFVAVAPGPVSYYIKGNTAGSNPFQGTFTIQESVDGATWTTLHQFVNSDLSISSYVQYTDVPNSASRYIRFFYTAKVSGWNVGLDEVLISVPAAGPSQEINIQYQSTTLFTGGTISFNSPGAFITDSLKIQNLGTVDTLTLSAPIISGNDSSDFLILSSPATVNANDSAYLFFKFTPGASGTRLATFTIPNNDSDENPYIINLYGVGGSYASEPSAQATNLNFSNIKSYRFTGSFTGAVPNPDGYLVLRKTGSLITDSPADGTIYVRGDYIGNSQVVFSGNATSFVPNNIVAGTDYSFSVFTYNGPGQYRNYLQANPLSNNVTTLSTMMGNYYTGISTADTNFLTNLHNKINPHTAIYYGDYENTIIPLFESRDTAGGQKVVTCVYSGFNFIYNDPYNWSVMSREHTYCHTWMPTFPADAPSERPEYNDQRHLFPAQFTNANQVRLNYPLGEVVTITSQFLGCKFGKDVNGKNVFEPRDEHKGDAARALFYMAVCYNGVNGNNWKFRDPISGSIPYGQQQDILKKWHFQDLPDSWEISRNDFLDSLQGNRNPFIDSVNFACYIDFLTMTKIDSPSIPCNSVGFNETVSSEDGIIIYPNPNDGTFQLSVFSYQYSVNKISLYNILGEEVYQSQISILNSQFSFDFPKGIYFLRLTSEEKTISRKIVID